MTTGLKWHGYIHVNGQLQVKRFFDGNEIDKSSPFVERYLAPVEADDREDAIKKLKERSQEF